MTTPPDNDPHRRWSNVAPLRDDRSQAVLGDLRVSVIMPVLNEAEGLAVTLPLLPRYASEVIVVDGGSADASREVVSEIRPDAAFLEQDGRGKGNALKAGIRVATGDIIVTMDADGSMDPGDIDAAIVLLLEGCHFVKGSRCLPGGGSDDFTAVRKAGNAFLTTVTNRAVGRRFTDITYGFNAYWRAVETLVHDLDEGFEFEIQLAVRAARSGLRTAEVPCYEATRVGGASKLHAVKDGVRILRSIVNEARAGEAHLWHLPDPVRVTGDVDLALIADRDATG